MTLAAGTLRNRVDIEEPTDGTDGNPEPTFSVMEGGLDVPAEILYVSGGERVRGQQMEATATALVTIRWRSGVTARHRFDVGGEKLNILRVYDPDNGRRVRLVCQCSEII